MTDLLELFDDLERQTEPERNEIIKAPFGYIGAKSRSIEKITPHLPYRSSYIEAFGGTGAILLARHPSNLEVLNDRYMGIVGFYRCIRNKDMMEKLCDWLEFTVHSREDFLDCRDTWENTNDDVERAAKWYYSIQSSFNSKGGQFGRSTNCRSALAGKIRNCLPMFPIIHERLLKVQIENQDWYQCLLDYDHPDAVFYLDPPYINTYPGAYLYEISKTEHIRLVETIFSLKGFVALSGYSNPLYEEQDWSSRFDWDIRVSSKSMAFTESNNLAGRESITERSTVKEVLWIKESE